MPDEALRRLTRLHGVELSYVDAAGRFQEASEEALLRTLQALGAPVRAARDAPAAIQAKEEERKTKVLEPVVVAWEGRSPPIPLSLPAGAQAGPLSCRLRLEDGSVRPLKPAEDSQGRPSLRVEEPLPNGYHSLTVEWAGRSHSCLLLSAPRRCRGPSPRGAAKSWGLFLPLHALHSKRSWGAGDFSDLAALARWAGRQGADWIGTLPLLPLFLDKPFDPSPYAPVSRLFWGEFWVDPTRVPEFRRCRLARGLLQRGEFARELSRLRAAPRVDYRRQMALKRRLLEPLADSLERGGSRRRGEFERFLKQKPLVLDYARFRAACEERRAVWRFWPSAMREGNLQGAGLEERRVRRHAYFQWVAQEQMGEAARASREAGAGLYLDLPLGVHPDGYDVWKEQRLFALDAAVGAPPGALFTKGQNWGFPLPHPDALRLSCHRYFAESVRHLMSRAAWMRIDHVMGLWRLFWIPKGMKAAEGVYVRYPAEEMLVVLCLESHRGACAVAGENLGTVPPEVNAGMSRHGLRQLFVAQYELKSDLRSPLREAPADSVAMLNTHDMPPFAAFWRRIGKGSFAALMACLEEMAAGPAEAVLINLEDLWGERKQQNVPGTGRERPNWRFKGKFQMEEFFRMPRVIEALKTVRRLRRGKQHGRGSVAH